MFPTQRVDLASEINKHTQVLLNYYLISFKDTPIRKKKTCKLKTLLDASSQPLGSSEDADKREWLGTITAQLS